jgi:O-antigen biosynthesis protein
MTDNQKSGSFFNVLFRGIVWLPFGRNVRKFSKVWSTYKQGGLRLCWARAKEKFGNAQFPYESNANQLSVGQSEFLIESFKNKPLISIITPVYNVDTKWLRKCIESAAKQYYKNWELILVDDASQSDEIKQTMESLANEDNRIRVYFLEKNSGIAAATNFGISHAKGEFVGFLDHDDELTPDALTLIVWSINEYPDALWFYSDEDKISHDDKCYEPYFKPDFSPELLLANMFTCHFSVYHTKVLKQVGGLRLGFDGAQDHDLALRISEIVPAGKIIHVPRVLYHWRSISGSAAMYADEKPLASESGRKAVTEALQRRGVKGNVTSNKLRKTIYMIDFQPKSFPEVTIIIPTRNSLTLLKNCLNSLRRNTKYPNYKVLVIDNQSDDIEFLDYIRQKQSEDSIKVIKYDKPFNHSEMNNIAAESVDSELVVFMNNDIEMISENWLEQLVGTVNIDRTIACAGCLLLYKNKTVQHGGIILGLQGLAGHAHQYILGELPGYNGRLQTLQEMSAVTAALMIVKKDVFEKICGFHADRYPTLLNDVDLCLRFRKAGYRCIYNPIVKAYHYESKTRPIMANEHEYREKFKKEYGEILMNDPFYNPNLSLNNAQFQDFRPFPITEQIPALAKSVKKG